MSLSDWASAYPPNNNTDSIASTNVAQNRKTDRNRRNSTIKKKFSGPKQIESMMELQNKLSGDDDEENGNSLAAFEPLAPPTLREPAKKTVIQPASDTKQTSDTKVSESAFANMVLPEGYQNYIPYTNQQSNTGMLQHNDNVMLEKINYMIHLLEEQKDEQTGHVAEELILYTFLGVFVIFVLDSFVKTGKYSR